MADDQAQLRAYQEQSAALRDLVLRMEDLPNRAVFQGDLAQRLRAILEGRTKA